MRGVTVERVYIVPARKELRARPLVGRSRLPLLHWNHVKLKKSSKVLNEEMR